MLSDPSFRHSTRERTDFWLFLPNFGRDRSSVSQIQSVIRVQTHNSFLPGSYHSGTKVLTFTVTWIVLTCRYGHLWHQICSHFGYGSYELLVRGLTFGLFRPILGVTEVQSHRSSQSSECRCTIRHTTLGQSPYVCCHMDGHGHP